VPMNIRSASRCSNRLAAVLLWIVTAPCIDVGFGFMERLAVRRLLLPLLALTASCSAVGGVQASPSAIPSPPAAVRECPRGDATLLGAAASGYRHDARDCLWSAYVNRQSTLFTTTGTTIEGARYNWTLTVRVDGTVAAVRELIDPRTFECKKLEKQPKEGDPTKFGFRLTDCGAGVPFVNVP